MNSKISFLLWSRWERCTFGRDNINSFLYLFNNFYGLTMLYWEECYMLEIQRGNNLRSSCHKGIKNAVMETERTNDQRLGKASHRRWGIHLRMLEDMKIMELPTPKWGLDGPKEENRVHKRIGLPGEPQENWLSFFWVHGRKQSW